MGFVLCSLLRNWLNYFKTTYKCKHLTVETSSCLGKNGIWILKLELKIAKNVKGNKGCTSEVNKKLKNKWVVPLNGKGT